MKLAIMSDLHLECAKYDLEFPDANLLLLAGDISSMHPSGLLNGKRFRDRAYEFYGRNNVLEIDGNHTAYGGTIDDFSSSSRFCVCINEVAIICATLWSGEGSEYAYKCLNDKYIAGFSWEWMYNRHKRDLAFIEKALIKTKGMKQVVMTHHMPSIECVHPKWIALNNGDIKGINLGFYTDLDWLINKYEPMIWNFGHTHDSMHKFHSNGKTQLICNPRGYRKFNGLFENMEFNPYKVIEI